EWLPVDRPLALTESPRTEALVATSPLTEVAPRIPVTEIVGAAHRMRTQVAQDPLATARRDLVGYYLGDVTPGASTERFLNAIDRLIELRDAEQRRLADVRGRGIRPRIPDRP